MSASAEKTSSLDEKRSRAFIQRLRNHPFIALVVNDDGTVEIFQKSILPEHIAQIREALEEAQP